MPQSSCCKPNRQALRAYGPRAPCCHSFQLDTWANALYDSPQALRTMHAWKRLTVKTPHPTETHTTPQLQDQSKTEAYMFSAANPPHERPPMQSP